MSVNRRSFLRALIGAPFAAKALEAIIAKSVAAPVVTPVPVVPTPEPKWTLPAANDADRRYTTAGFERVFYPSRSVIRLSHAGNHPIVVGQTVRINAEGQVELCERYDPKAFGFVFQQSCSSNTLAWQHDIEVQTFDNVSLDEVRRLQYSQVSIEPHAPKMIEVSW